MTSAGYDSDEVEDMIEDYDTVGAYHKSNFLPRYSYSRSIASKRKYEADQSHVLFGNCKGNHRRLN